MLTMRNAAKHPKDSSVKKPLVASHVGERVTRRSVRAKSPQRASPFLQESEWKIVATRRPLAVMTTS